MTETMTQTQTLTLVENPLAHLHNTDLGNSERFVAQHGQNLHYCATWARWYVWDGRRWAYDEIGQVMELAKCTVRDIYQEAANMTVNGTRQELGKHALRSESANRLAAMVSLAQTDPMIAVVPDDFDTDPWLLNVKNGTLNLRSGELRPHAREDLITKLAPVVYDPSATCPTWWSFLNDIMDGGDSLKQFLKRGVGYSLTGLVTDKALFVLWGEGDNGKTTFLKAVYNLLGDYALNTSTSTLMAKKWDGIPNDVARLKGARFVSASESEQGRRLNESLIKDLTGGDTVSARFMRAEWFDFTPECKVFLGTNHKPEIRGTDNAIWNRIKLVPFEVVIPKAEQDKHLGDKLALELSGILNWALAGCLDWQHIGLAEPEEVVSATKAYRNEMDELRRFSEDCCIKTDLAQVTKHNLYNAYLKWGGDLSKNKFSRAMIEQGFDGEQRDTKGERIWKGIGLLTTEEGQPQDPHKEAMKH